ncbi:MAG: hypothetical protein M1376_05215 [Planctomycetes bacterium]|nr:hypothetical protein [Planctomycetota bacterium]
MIAGALICPVVMLLGMPQGPGQVFTIAVENHKFSLGSFGLSVAEPTFWVVLVYGITMNLQNFGIDQNYVQRYIASRSDREARKSVWIGGLLYIPISALFFFIGTCLFAYYQAHPVLLDEVRTTVAVQRVGANEDSPLVAAERDRLTQADIQDKVFPHFIGAALPAGVTGLLVAAVFAAAMSTVATSLNSSATLLLRDYYQRYINRSASESQSMRVLHVSTIVWGVLGTGLALLLIRVTSALDAWWTLSGIFGGGMLGLFLLGMISRRAGNAAAVTGVIAGISILGWMTLSKYLTGPWESLRSPFHAFLIPVFGTLTILLLGVLLSQFLAPPKGVRSPIGDKV